MNSNPPVLLNKSEKYITCTSQYSGEVFKSKVRDRDIYCFERYSLVEGEKSTRLSVGLARVLLSYTGWERLQKYLGHTGFSSILLKFVPGYHSDPVGRLVARTS